MIKEIKTTRVPKKGFKVYLDGEKYPKKPLDCYPVNTEREAVIRAYGDAGLDHSEILDIIFDEEVK